MVGKEVVQIFVGAGDFQDQNELLNQRKAQGWIVGPTSTSGVIVDVLRNISGKMLKLMELMLVDVLPMLHE